MATASAQPSNPFIKQLAANDRPTRDKAVTALRSYLHRSSAFSPLDLLKLWKGLFYCMWMSDKPRPQQQLALDLGSLVEVLSRANFLPFVAAFWRTMAREWAGIDVLRMDKFLFLVRQYVNAAFRYLARADWSDEELVLGYLDVLKEVPLNARDVKVPNGLRYHVVDVLVDELDQVDTARKAPVEMLLRPLRALGKESKTKSVRERVAEALQDERLSDWAGTAEVDGESDEEADGVQAHEKGSENGDEWGGFDD